MSSDPKSPNGGNQIEDLTVSVGTEAMDADSVRGGYSLGASNPGVKAGPTGDGDYRPNGPVNLTPGLGTP